MRPAGGLALFDEAVQLLRATPIETWVFFLAGTIPLLVGLLWFWTDCTRSVYAQAHLAWSSLLVASLFLWKQAMESVFLAQLVERLSCQTPPAARPLGRMLLRQAAVQPSALLALPFAAIAAVPFAGTVFFYRSFSLASIAGPAGALSHAWRLSRVFSLQAWVFLSVLGLIALASYLNLLVTVLVLAQLSKSVFGKEHLLTEPLTLLRTPAVHICCLMVTYLVADALLNAAAALRAFYGESVRSGGDIVAILRGLGVRTAPIAVVLVTAGNLWAAPADQHALNQSIERTLQQPEYAWRMPPRVDELPAVANWFVRVMEAIGEGIRWLLETLERFFQSKPPPEFESGGAGGWQVSYWLMALAVVAAAGLLFLVVRRSRSRANTAATPVEAPRVVDVRDENAGADQLPEDSWLSLADQLIAEGDLRAALRALHFCALRLLAERRLVTLERWKSGLEYLQELRRRSRGLPELGNAFAGGLRLFEFGWYGHRPVDAATIDRYRQLLGEIRGHANA
jgi:hypothetical protein